MNMIIFREITKIIKEVYLKCQELTRNQKQKFFFQTIIQRLSQEQVWSDIQKSVIIIYLTNTCVKTIHLILEIEKTFNKIPYPLTLKTLRELGTEQNFVSLVKGICKNPTANIILNGRNIKYFGSKMINKSITFSHITSIPHYWRCYAAH